MGIIDWFIKPLKEPQVDAGKTSLSVREQALANMRAARERIGDAEIQKMAASLREESMRMRAEKARKEILATDKAKIASHIKDLMNDGKK